MKTQKLSTVLSKALKLIKKGWCKGYSAKDRHSHNVDVDSPRAARYCALGAICKAYGGLNAKDTTKSIDFFYNNIVLPSNYMTTFYWNDAPKRTKKEVIEAFKKVIKLAKAKEEK